MMFTRSEALITIKQALPEYIDWDLDEVFQHCFNEDYYIIGTYDAAKAIEAFGDHIGDCGVYSAIEWVKNYIADNALGLEPEDVLEDITNPEGMANLIWYCVGDSVMQSICNLADILPNANVAVEEGSKEINPNILNAIDTLENQEIANK